jgi:hypothetical protein
VRQNRFAQCGIGQTAEHGDLDATHDLAGADSKRGKSENPVTAALDEAFEKASRFHEASGTQHGGHGNFEKPVRNTLFLRIGLAESDAGELAVGEEAERHLPAGGHTVAAEDVIANNAEIILADVGEVWTS